VSEAPTPAGTSLQFFLTGVIKPVSEYLRMHLQADKPLFPLARLRRRPPEELSAGRGKKAEEKKEVIEASGSPLSAFPSLSPNLLDLLLWYRMLSNFSA